jgi:hypothetical protein
MAVRTEVIVAIIGALGIIGSGIAAPLIPSIYKPLAYISLDPPDSSDSVKVEIKNIGLGAASNMLIIIQTTKQIVSVTDTSTVEVESSTFQSNRLEMKVPRMPDGGGATINVEIGSSGQTVRNDYSINVIYDQGSTELKGTSKTNSILALATNPTSIIILLLIYIIFAIILYLYLRRVGILRKLVQSLINIHYTLEHDLESRERFLNAWTSIPENSRERWISDFSDYVLVDELFRMVDNRAVILAEENVDPLSVTIMNANILKQCRKILVSSNWNKYRSITWKR